MIFFFFVYQIRPDFLNVFLNASIFEESVKEGLLSLEWRSLNWFQTLKMQFSNKLKKTYKYSNLTLFLGVYSEEINWRAYEDFRTEDATYPS